MVYLAHSPPCIRCYPPHTCTHTLYHDHIGLTSISLPQISPNHCSCPGSHATNCTNELRDLSQELNLTEFSSNCSQADYVSETLPKDLRWMFDRFENSSTLKKARKSAFYYLISCQAWKDQFIPADSHAHSQFPCTS